MSEAHNCRFIASTIKMQRFLIHVCSAHTSRPSALYLISPLICTWLSVYLENRKKSRERRVSRAALTRDGNPAVSGRELAPAGHETADFKERELQRTPLVPLSLSSPGFSDYNLSFSILFYFALSAGVTHLPRLQSAACPARSPLRYTAYFLLDDYYFLSFPPRAGS